MDPASWSAAHVAAFEFFGGVPAGRIALDNLKTGVVRPDLYDPKLNRTYAELCAHYLLTEPLPANIQVERHVLRPPVEVIALKDSRPHDQRTRTLQESSRTRVDFDGLI
jgi:hypothetical protein